MVSLQQQLNKLTRQLEKTVSNLVTREDMRDVANLAIELIVSRTRAGKGVKRPGGNTSKLAALSDEYIEFRRRNRARLSPTTRFDKSNLTFSGQLLSSIQVIKVSKIKNRQVAIIGAKPNRRDDGTTNTQVAEWVQRVRPFFFLSKGEATKVSAELAKRIKSKT